MKERTDIETAQAPESDMGSCQVQRRVMPPMQLNQLYNMDCMEGMAQFPDKYFDLAIVDPPYGINISGNPVRQLHDKKKWDNEIPSEKYFNELFRVSKNQIIWGGNYFNLPASQGFFIWDKKQPFDFSLSMCEFAWTSFQVPAKIYYCSVLAEKNKVHPTQKPRALYRWLLSNYAEGCNTILDTHVGSGSSIIEFELNGFDWIGFELDEDYYKATQARFKRETAQANLFDPRKLL